MANFFAGVQGVLTILLMISGGWILGRKNWFPGDTITVISRLVLQISIPAMMLSSVISTFTREDIIRMGPALLLPLISISFLYCLSAALAKILRVPADRRGVFRANIAFSNTVFVGIPVNVALFGEQAAPYVTLYYLVNTVLFWTIGVYFIRRDNKAQRVPIFSLKSLQQIFSPSIICFGIALFLVLYEINLPVFILGSLKYMAALTTPLAMLVIGVGLDLSALRRVNREIVTVLFARFILAPSLIFFLLTTMDIPSLMKKVFLVTAGMPVMTQITLIAKAYGADHENAGIAATVTTAASLVAIPIYMILFGDL
ncbi:MAG: AEC family transporter [Spirochaetales bacterium]|jgi:predicted permease|nr:AEC family transporter [Spirochaetales bacterium]